jgi:hypothetical protein
MHGMECWNWVNLMLMIDLMLRLFFICALCLFIFVVGTYII